MKRKDLYWIACIVLLLYGFLSWQMVTINKIEKEISEIKSHTSELYVDQLEEEHNVTDQELLDLDVLWDLCMFVKKYEDSGYILHISSVSIKEMARHMMDENIPYDEIKKYISNRIEFEHLFRNHLDYEVRGIEPPLDSDYEKGKY